MKDTRCQVCGYEFSIKEEGCCQECGEEAELESVEESEDCDEVDDNEYWYGTEQYRE